MLIDAGANADARPEHLLQFGHMGTVFAREILGVEDPVVRLLSIGEEDEKGNQLTLEAGALLRESGLRYAGHTESRTLLEGDTDVVVTDGFTGNVALKALEGTIRTILDALRAELGSSIRGRVGGLVIRPAARAVRHRLDPETYGGAYLLGLRGLVVIAHGSSSRVRRERDPAGARESSTTSSHACRATLGLRGCSRAVTPIETLTPWPRPACRPGGSRRGVAREGGPGNHGSPSC